VGFVYQDLRRGIPIFGGNIFQQSQFAATENTPIKVCSSRETPGGKGVLITCRMDLCGDKFLPIRPGFFIKFFVKGRRNRPFLPGVVRQAGNASSHLLEVGKIEKIEELEELGFSAIMSILNKIKGSVDEFLAVVLY